MSEKEKEDKKEPVVDTVQKERLRKTGEIIEEELPLFSDILYKIKYYQCDHMPTAGVDRLLHFHYNPKFIESLDDHGLKFVYIHEVLHLVGKHVENFDKTRTHQENNIAMDLAINSIIVQILGLSPKGLEWACFPSKVNLPELKSWRWYLDHLPNIMEQFKDQLKKILNDIEDALDKQAKGENIDGTPLEKLGTGGEGETIDRDQLDQETKDQLDRIAEKLNKAQLDDKTEKELGKGLEEDDEEESDEKNKNNDKKSKGHGQGFGGGSTLKNVEKQPSFPNLKSILDKIISKRKLRDKSDYTYSKISRRFQGYTDGIIRPGKLSYDKPQLNMAIVVDISGSVHGVLKEIFTGIDQLKKDLKKNFKHDIDLYFTGDKVELVQNLEEFSLDKKVPYGGGTWMFAGYEAACNSQKKYSEVMVISDMEDSSFSKFEEYNKKCYLATICYSEDEYKRILDRYLSQHLITNKNLIPLMLKLERN